MNEETLELLATAGPLSGRRFAISGGGLRIGRSSSCEIAISDPALSRNHCLLEMRDGDAYVTDLASANGTVLNGSEVGPESVKLRPGDELSVGETSFRIVRPGDGGDAPAPDPAPAAGPVPPVDLGFGAPHGGDSPRDGGRNRLRAALWTVAILAAAAAGYVIVSTPATAPAGAGGRELPKEKLHRLLFETVKADTNGIFRYEMTVDGEGLLKVSACDLPDGGRNLEKSRKLDGKAVARLSDLLAPRAVAELEPAYVGPAVSPCRYERARIRFVRGTRIRDVLVENMAEPEPFRELRTALETFSQHELGIVGIQLPREELLRKSDDAARTAEERWEARDVELGNLSAAIGGWNDALYFLETVNPKPDGYERLLKRRDEARAELDRRWRERYFEVDRAVSQEDWQAAQRELVALCAMISDRRDARYDEARKKLADVEARIRKGGAK